jgi:hypothetical protein
MITLARRTDQDLMPAPHPSSPRTLALVGVECGPTAHEAGRAAGHGAKDTPALWEDAAVAEVDVEQLRGATLFSVLRPEQLERFLDAATLTEHAEGEPLTEQGVLGHRFHLLVEGTAAVERDGSVIATIGPGDFVGEIGLLGGGPSTATVRCTAPIQCLTLRREVFWEVLEAEPAIALRILEVVCRRVAEEWRPDARANIPESRGR